MQGKHGKADEHEVQEDDLGTAFYRDETIDLGDLVREQLYLALPMKPLCAEACKGLCPQCGTNLNRGTCDCRSEWQDPAFRKAEGPEEGPPTVAQPFRAAMARIKHAESKTTTLQNADREAAHA